MNAHTKAIKELESAGYFLKRNGKSHDIYYNAKKRRSIPLKRHDFDEDDLRYILKEIQQGEK